MSELEVFHSKRLENILFTDPNGSPPWLRALPSICLDRYSEIQLTDQFKTAINAFDDDDNPKPFELFVVGEGKFGKSTIVNCLLGEELSRVNGLPETRCFHRYVFKENPTDTTKLFLRTKAGVHDWLTSQLNQGKAVRELFEILEYEVPSRNVKNLVTEDITRQEVPGYIQAVYEIESDVKMNDLSPFKREIRVVDTQGLDQIFPNDVYSAMQSVESSSINRCDSWMHETPRGRHLDWQFRRCDAVLWCINAKRLNSAATRDYLKYFSRYSKKVVIALTHIDVGRNEKERAKLIAKASKLYSSYSNVIIPVDGKLAWDGISNSDESKYRLSGAQDLVNKLVCLCDNDGIRVRNISRYNGLRQTEKQYRHALRILRQDYFELLEKHKFDLGLISTSRERTKREISNIARQRGSKDLNEMLPGIRFITLNDNLNDVESKLKIGVNSRIFRNYVMSIFDTFLSSEVNKLNDVISPYQIPCFDADGEKAGYVMSHHINVQHSQFEIKLPEPKLQLGNLFERLANKFDGLLGIFSNEAKQRKEKRIYDLHVRIENEFRDSWEYFIRNAENNINTETDRQFDDIKDAIQQVMDKIQRDSGGSLSQSIEGIDKALSSIAVPSVVMEKMVNLFRVAFKV